MNVYNIENKSDKMITFIQLEIIKMYVFVYFPERKVLKEENRVLKEQMMCKICMDKDANTVFLPCGHLVSCVDCANALTKCAVCRTIIQGTVRVYPA
jgi:hypothetical protein